MEHGSTKYLVQINYLGAENKHAKTIMSNADHGWRRHLFWCSICAPYLKQLGTVYKHEFSLTLVDSNHSCSIVLDSVSQSLTWFLTQSIYNRVMIHVIILGKWVSTEILNHYTTDVFCIYCNSVFIFFCFIGDSYAFTENILMYFYL